MMHKPRIENILFATDLSENSELAFSYAASLAEAYGARVTILYVMEKLTPNAELLLASYLGYDVEELRRNSEIDLTVQIKMRIEQFCAEAADQLPACRFILHEVLVEPGKPIERILHHAGTGRYDALVMGSRGQGLVKESLMGGTSRKVVVSSPIPVFVISMKVADPETERD
ncbi:MAG: universal stress protein [Desulfobacteraceae bacterium]|nr:MAG: universal stress protein [Desulfobacteraceae bacterium]